MLRSVLLRSVAVAVVLIVATTGHAFGGKKKKCSECTTACEAACTSVCESAAPACDTGCGTAAPCAAAAAPCAVAAAPCAPAAPTYKMVEQLVTTYEMVPTVQKVKTQEYKNVEKERTVTYNQMVQKTRQVTHNVCSYENVVEKKVENYTECVAVWTEKDVKVCKMVPVTEKKSGVKNVVTCVPTTECKTYTVNEGHWVDQCYTVCKKVKNCCGGCDIVPVTCTKKVWVCTPVTKTCMVTVNKQVCTQVPYEYEVTTCKAVETMEKVKVCSYQSVPKSREVSYTVCKQVVKPVVSTETYCECVPMSKVEKYTVCEAFWTEKDVTVNVCTPVTKKVMVQVAEAPCATGCGTPSGCETGCSAAPACPTVCEPACATSCEPVCCEKAKKCKKPKKAKC